MKAVIGLAMTFLISGCGFFTTGEGKFTGRVVDVEWGGLIFKSCEVNFQLGEQSSSISTGSTRDKQMCDELQSKMGEVVTVKYQTWVQPCCLRLDSPYELIR